MTAVPTNKGGPFYVWYESVYGYAPPSSVDDQACRYIAWKQGWPKVVAAAIPYGTVGNCGIYDIGSALAAPPPQVSASPPPAPPSLASAGTGILPAAPSAPAPTAALTAPAAGAGSPVATAASAGDQFESTAYGPPWGGIQGDGTTATGLDLTDSPHVYIVAVDPSVIPLHTHIRASPNPFGDDSIVFSAEDTGGAINGNHIDFYDWRGRASQLAWGKRTVTVTRTTAKQTSGGGVGVNSYYNPLVHAKVTPERIDQGVDYAGTGYLVAIADGVVTASVKDGSGWEGEGYIEYKVTQPGFLEGAYIYYAEGVDTVVNVGEKVSGGARLCDLRQPMPHGIEIGFAAGSGNEDSYYRYHDGPYNEGDATRPGVAFSNLIKALGGPPGVIEGPVVGKFPEYMPSGEPPSSLVQGTSAGPLSGGPSSIPASTAANDFDWPNSLYSAFIQIQRGADNGSHHSHSAQADLMGITYVTQAT
jgi:3D (Asp-Asp-Asp) domain-containing protein